jgi:hypothetical protein
MIWWQVASGYISIFSALCLVLPFQWSDILRYVEYTKKTCLLAMGQGMTHAMQPEEELRPGTYRIVSGLTGTAIQVSDHDHTKVVAWERHDGESQQVCSLDVQVHYYPVADGGNNMQKWFLQRSGDGYKFKNRRHGTYLAVCSTDIHSLAYAARYPTTWVLLKTDDCYV